MKIKELKNIDLLKYIICLILFQYCFVSQLAAEEVQPQAVELKVVVEKTPEEIPEAVIEIVPEEISEATVTPPSPEVIEPKAEELATIPEAVAPIVVAPPAPVLEIKMFSKEQFAHTLNLAGRQRMLSQKMAKEALFVQSNIDIQSNRDQLDKTLKAFKKTLAALKEGDDSLALEECYSKEIKQQLEVVDGLFQKIEPIYLKIVQNNKLTQDELVRISIESVTLLKNMNKAVLMYEKDSQSLSEEGNTKDSSKLNLAGKQRMLAQKISKEILLVYLSIDIEKNQKSLNASKDLFSDTLFGFQKGSKDLDLTPLTDENHLKQINTIQMVWDFFLPTIENISIMGKGGITRFEMTYVDVFNMPLLKESNKLVGMIEQTLVKH